MSQLVVEGIHTYYGESHILHGVSLSVAPGEAVALLGRNGAGKTTMIRSIVGFTPPRAGRIVLAPLSVRENLLLGARADGWTLERIFALFPRLRERQQQVAGTLSGGEQQMLALGRALLTNGRMLLLDEPSEGLAPLIVREIGRVVQRLKGERLSILLVEQNYHLALQVADRVYVMNKGQIVYEGDPASLERDEEVKRRYLGVA
jgi:branched-chain amino acid transport system ATP-binding protein